MVRCSDDSTKGKPIFQNAPERSMHGRGELARISVDADETRPVQVFVTQARNQILFQVWGKDRGTKGAFHRVELVSELIDARYPDYQAIIPKRRTTRTIVDTA